MEIGTYVGDCNVKYTYTQDIVTAFAPKFVMVADADSEGAPWYYDSDIDDDGYYTDMDFMDTGFAFYGYPLPGHVVDEILTITSTGFTVCNDRAVNTNSSGTKEYSTYYYLNRLNHTYCYLAIG